MNSRPLHNEKTQQSIKKQACCYEFMIVLFYLLFHQFHHESIGLEEQAEAVSHRDSELDVEGGCASQNDDAINICPPNCFSLTLSIAIV